MPFNHLKPTVAVDAPAVCAAMKPGTSTGRMPAKVSVMERATVTAGFANDVEARHRRRTAGGQVDALQSGYALRFARRCHSQDDRRCAQKRCRFSKGLPASRPGLLWTKELSSAIGSTSAFRAADSLALSERVRDIGCSFISLGDPRDRRCFIVRSRSAGAPPNDRRALCEAQRSRVGCGTLLGFVLPFQTDHYFSASVSLPHIPYSRGDFTQPVAFIDDRR